MTKKLLSRVAAGTCVLAAAGAFAGDGADSLVPMPRELRRTGGVCTSGVVREAHDAQIPAEGYRLDIASDGISIASSDAAGAFYARQTLAQLCDETAGVPQYPCVTIEDAPAFRWRGFLLDEGRRFFGKETVKHVLDLMARYKLNVFHWHLTEDQGWRIDVPGMPELVKYGSIRPESPCHGAKLKKLGKYQYRSEAMNGIPYGPYYYTEADLKEIIDYAAKLHITVVPEIDLPGHAMAMLAAYPNLACFPENIKTRMAASDWGIFPDVLCVGNDDTVRFVDRLVDYVCDVFPSEVIHIGGDECPFVSWERCPKCQARMKAEKLASAKDLQGWITRHVAERLAKRGRRIMGWDEILAGDIPLTAIGQSWRTSAENGAGTDHVSGAAGAERGHDMVINPHDETYYSYQQGLADDPFFCQGHVLSLKKAYAFDPLRGVSAEARAHVLGGEACLWGEYIWNEYDLDWRAWPRTLAMAEILWSNPSRRDYGAFAVRAAVHRRRLLHMGVNCAPLE